MRELEPLVGEWEMEARPPGGEPGPGEARVVFEWIEDGLFLRESWQIEMPEAPDGVAIIGWDRSRNAYTQLYTDERGVHRIYEMSFADGEWRMWREDDDPFPQRFSGRLSEDGETITGRFEKLEEGAWGTDFDVTYRRVS